MSQTFSVPWTLDTTRPSKEQTMNGHFDVPARHAYVKGLVITRNVIGMERWSDEWVITHKASGRYIPGILFPTIASARRAAKAIEDIADWTDPDLLLSITDEQKVAVVEAMKAEADAAWGKVPR